MKKILTAYTFWVIAALLCLAVGVAVVFSFNRESDAEPTTPFELTMIRNLRTISDHSKIQAALELQSKTLPLTLEVVNTPVSLAEGLGNRTEIGSDGMLFVFQEPTETHFWMYGMQFDLDLIWIKGDTIVDITKSVPAPRNADTQNKPTNRNLSRYLSPGEIDMVLEVPAGFSREQGILPGDRLLIK
jgi:uncharacterized membrane protein (UPF0127 family)